MDITAIQATLVPVVLAIVQLIKGVGLPTKWAPLLAVVLGFTGVWMTLGHMDILTGITVGLASAGLWSGAKTTLKQ